MTNTEAYKARIEAAGSRDALQAIETEVRKDRGLTSERRRRSSEPARAGITSSATEPRRGRS